MCSGKSFSVTCGMLCALLLPIFETPCISRRMKLSQGSVFLVHKVWVLPRLPMTLLPVFVLIVLLTNLSPCSACTEKDFDKWVVKYRRHEYLDLKGENRAIRLSLFCNTTRAVLAHNKKYEIGQSTYYMKVNQFAALTDEERDRLFGARLPSSTPIKSDSQGLVKSTQRQSFPAAKLIDLKHIR